MVFLLELVLDLVQRSHGALLVQVAAERAANTDSTNHVIAHLDRHAAGCSR